VVSESVQKTRNLLGRYDITTRVLSYREENAARMGKVVLGLLERGLSVALVAEAGTPGVSDPGRKLVDAAWKGGFAVVPVPGASAALAAVSVSGLEEPRFVFEGFLPRRGSKRRQRLRELAGDTRALVFFEAPHRLVECLADLELVLGDRLCVVAREISKLHEEIVREKISYFVAKYSEREPIGEFVVICEGSAAGGPGAAADPEAAVAEARDMVAAGARAREAAKAVARRHGLKARDIYAALVRRTEARRTARRPNRKGEAQ